MATQTGQPHTLARGVLPPETSNGSDERSEESDAMLAYILGPIFR